ncbi:translation initiation factor IF-2 subunit beta [Halalkaliarchaeum sp. AArc-GB]|uniref:translation initiation factor IF-2 subunit beta n=1 Tax=Halalkaliarchaeum sp. AArc-GB TaxID=3074078 RepID=UPI00285F3FBE|nr:translation initiation factor IF-2 subunit beta [Halalkaliarchaeum sp. AArc-GB]MDR5673137.1 translation initiation factor IF-2 subunit beta [Halalkaliarchaeum sp. AArc-GB]
MDYEASLDRAIDAMPELGGEEARLRIPDAEAEPDGAFTRFTNISAVADALSRDPEHLHSHVQQELGTAGQYESGRARYNGNFSGADFDEAVEGYVSRYVTCSECGLPDTRLVTEDRTEMLRCEACGAFRPVAKGHVSKPNRRERETVEKGKTYELEIISTGRKGDGVAERGEYTIFVSGAREGETVRAYVESVSGTLAFARKA